MKKSMKRIVSILLTLAMVASMASIVFAAIEPPDIGGGPTAGSGLSNVASKVLGYVQFFGYAIAVGMLLYIGIKYMMASANEKADLKKGSINYVIGAVLVAGATAIVSIFANIGKAISQ